MNEPSEQGLQTGLFCEFEKNPTEQDAQVLALRLGPDVPGGQSVHVGRPVSDEKVPMAQAPHAVAPGFGWMKPAAQSVQND